MNSKRMGTILRLLGIGWYVGICIAAGAVSGLWADDRLGLSPFLTLAGVGVGLIAAIAGMYRMLLAVLGYISDKD